MLKQEKKTSKSKKKTGDRNRSWAEAIKHCGLFYGREVAIVLICKKVICPTCGNDEFIKHLKWKVVTNKGKKCALLEEYPLNCNAEAAFGKYGLPMEFISGYGYCEDGEIIKPMKVQ
jgi:hypothetical protein